MASKRKREELSVTDIAEHVAEQYVNGNKAFVKEYLLTKLDERYVPIVTLRVYDMLYNPRDMYLASSFMRFVESFTY